MSEFTRKGVGLDNIRKRTKYPGVVDVGIIDAGTHTDGDASVATIAYQHEYGTATIPERPFFRSTMREKKATIIKMQKAYMKKISTGEMTTEEALGLLGEYLAGAIRKKITDIKSPPNSPATIAAKGSSNPLVDTAQMRNSVTYEVNR